MDSALVAESFRRDAGRALATLARALRDIELAEDAVQDAYVAALEQWPRRGIPANPAAWIITSARNGAIDRLRRQQVAAEKHRLSARFEDALAAIPAIDDADAGAAIPDDRLALIFACAHPSLALEARIALVLRAVARLSTEEIARAFLVPVATVAQRLVRAKRKIRDARIPLDVPPPERLAERLDDVCTVVYLIFNEGYAPRSGERAIREELCAEAIRLGRLLAGLLPNEPEVLGLLALMMFHHARRDARYDETADAVTLEEQDRSRWHRPEIDAALRVLVRAAWFGREGQYQLQAAIAAVHVRAPVAAQTNWRAIAQLYARLADLAPSPVVELNRAVAVAMSDGPAAGLAILERLEPVESLRAYPPLHAARAELLRRQGDRAAAALAYTRALALPQNDAERRFVERRLRELEGEAVRA